MIAKSRANESRAELARAMPSAAVIIEHEKAIAGAPGVSVLTTMASAMSAVSYWVRPFLGDCDTINCKAFHHEADHH